MLYKNTLVTGALLGSVLPAISLFIFLYILKGNYLIMDKPGIPYMVAVLFNLFIIRYCYKKSIEKAGAGLVLVTCIFMLVIFVFKLQPIQ